MPDAVAAFARRAMATIRRGRYRTRAAADAATGPALFGPDPRCPVCGGVVTWDLTCRTYYAGNRWSACLPCDSALEYECGRPDCPWAYTHGLAVANPRSAGNETRRPAWLPAPLEFSTAPGLPIHHPDVAYRWAFDDENQEVHG